VGTLRRFIIDFGWFGNSVLLLYILLYLLTLLLVIPDIHHHFSYFVAGAISVRDMAKNLMLFTRVVYKLEDYITLGAG
jgi:hypothetical protein